MDASHKDCIIFPGRIPAPEIGFVNALLDELDDVGVARTVDAAEGRLEFWIAPDMVDEFLSFAEFIRTEYLIPFTVDDPIPQSTEVAEFFEQISKRE